METSTIFANILGIAVVAAVIIFVIPKLKRNVVTAPAQDMTAELLRMIDKSVPQETHEKTIAALQASVPAVTRAPITAAGPTVSIQPPIAAAPVASPTEPPQQFDIHGRPIAPAPYGRDNYGNPFSSHEQAERWRAAVAKQKAGETARDEAHDRQVYEGPIPIAAITRWNAQTDGWDFSVRDSDYLNWAATVDGPSVWSAVCSGRTADIGRAINDSEGHFNYLQAANVDIDASYTGPCRQYRELFRAGALKPKYHLE